MTEKQRVMRPGGTILQGPGGVAGDVVSTAFSPLSRRAGAQETRHRGEGRITAYVDRALKGVDWPTFPGPVGRGRTGAIHASPANEASGSWDTLKWLISKEDAHLEGRNLVPDTQEARDGAAHARLFAPTCQGATCSRDQAEAERSRADKPTSAAAVLPQRGKDIKKAQVRAALRPLMTRM